MTTVKIENVRVLDPVTQTDAIETVYLNNAKRVPHLDEVAHVIDGQGQWLMPSMVDLCARLREPGQQQHGTLASEGNAARSAGILHILTPPDSKPIVQDNGALIHGLVEKAWNDGKIHLAIMGAQTQGLQGKQPANMAGLKKGGCRFVSNANAPFADDDVVLRTLEYAAGLDLTVVFYPEEPQIAKDGCVHESFVASRQGLPMISPLAETVAVAKYLLMVEATGVKAHFSLLSCGASIDLIQAAKEKGLPVTADVAMHQLHLIDELIDGFNSLAHVRPPLRALKDREKLREAVKTGIIDAICTHHEPLSGSAKLAPFAETEAGISAFDTYLPLGIQLVKDNVFTALEWVEKVTLAPAVVSNMVEQWQAEAGWILLDPALSWELTEDSMLSQGKNTPLLGQTMTGRVIETFYPTI